MIQQIHRNDVPNLCVGTVIQVGMGFYNHVGMLSDRVVDDERWVIAFSAKAGGLVEQPYSAFSQGRLVTVEGYLGCLSPHVVMARARDKRKAQYSWTKFNCEHFVRYAHGVAVESPQLQTYSWLAGGVGAFFLALRLASQTR